MSFLKANKKRKLFYFCPYCYESEEDASKSNGSDSNTNEDESSEEENVPPNNVEINRAGQKIDVFAGVVKRK